MVLEVKDYNVYEKLWDPKEKMLVPRIVYASPMPPPDVHSPISLPDREHAHTSIAWWLQRTRWHWSDVIFYEVLTHCSVCASGEIPARSGRFKGQNGNGEAEAPDSTNYEAPAPPGPPPPNVQRKSRRSYFSNAEMQKKIIART